MDASNPGKGSITTTRLSNSTSRTYAPNNVLKVAKLVCQTPLFFATTLAMFDFQSAAIFGMATTLCDGIDTPRMVVTPIEDSHEILFS
jgi:hypothetical protein